MSRHPKSTDAGSSSNGTNLSNLSLNNENYTNIRNKALRDDLEAEQATQKKLRDVKNGIREKRNELQAIKNRAHEAFDKQKDAITRQIDELLAKRSLVHQKVMSNRFQHDESAQLREHVNLLDTEIAVLRPRFRRISEDLKSIESDLKAKETAVTTLQNTRPSWKSADVLEQDLARTERSLLEATTSFQKTGNPRFNDDVKRLTRTRTDLVQAINDSQRMEHLKALCIETRNKLDIKKKELEEIQSNLTKCTVDRDAASKKLSAASVSKQNRVNNESKPDVSFQQIDQQVEALKKKRSQLTKEHTSADFQSSLTDKDKQLYQQVEESLNKLLEEQKQLNADLKDVSSRIYAVTLPCEGNVLYALQNAQSAKFKNFQSQHDVHIQVGALESIMVLRGIETEVLTAKEALEVLLKDVADHQHIKKMNINTQQVGDIIGTRGSVVTALQKEHGVSIDVQASNGTVLLKGTKEGISKAEEAILTLLRNAHHEVIEIPQHLLLPVFGRRLGPALQEMQSTFALKNLRLTQTTLSMTGSVESTAKCRSEVEQRMKKYEGNSTRVVVHESLIPAVIGKGGAVIRKIESETNTIIDIHGTTIWMHGTAEDVKQAQERIREITNRDEIRIPLDAATSILVTREFLSELKEQTNVDVQLVNHPETAILARGTREAIRNIKPIIDMKILKKKVNSRTCTFPTVLFNHLRGVKDSFCTKHQLEVISLDRFNGEATLIGRSSSTSLDDALDAWTAIILAAEQNIHTIKISPPMIPVIIGARGQTIKSITADSAAEIRVDNEKLEVQVYGNESAVQKATERIQKILDSESSRKPEQREE